MRLTKTSDLWWKNAVVYCLDVETFADGDGDGCGDFRGLIQNIDHLDRLGVTCLWLMPFFPTPDRDDGYDISDFYGVDPRLGTHGDVVELIRTARDRGIRVIADLVVNHTSNTHPWFQSARSSPDSPYRDWYVWRDDKPADAAQGVVFPDQETSTWEYDRTAKQYFQHQFYKFQPDLNIDNPEVRDEIARIMGFWMQLGLSGFRVDAVPFLLDTGDHDDAAALPKPHDYLADLAAFLRRRNGEAVLLGEVNVAYPDLMPFFGVRDGGGEAGALQQPGAIAQIGEGRHPGRRPAKQRRLRLGQRRAQRAQAAKRGEGGEEQPVGPQRPAQLQQRAGEVVDPVQRQAGHDQVEGRRGEGHELLVRRDRRAAVAPGHRRGEVAAYRLDPAGAQQGRHDAAAADVQGEAEAAGHVVQPVQQPFRAVAQQVGHRGHGRGGPVAVQPHRAAVEHHHGGHAIR